MSSYVLVGIAGGTASGKSTLTAALGEALQQAGKSFEVQVGPDAGHSGVNNQRMMEFFIENLIQHPERLKAPVAPAR